AEQARRQRAAAEATHQAEQAERRSKLAALLAEDLTDIRESEHHARALAAAIARRIKRNTEMAKLTHEVSDAPVPVVLHFEEVITRMGGWIGAILGSAIKPRGKLGPLKWSYVSLYPAETKSWHAVEAEAYAKHLTPLTKG